MCYVHVYPLSITYNPSININLIKYVSSVLELRYMKIKKNLCAFPDNLNFNHRPSLEPKEKRVTDRNPVGFDYVV